MGDEARYEAIIELAKAAAKLEVTPSGAQSAANRIRAGLELVETPPTEVLEEDRLALLNPFQEQQILDEIAIAPVEVCAENIGALHPSYCANSHDTVWDNRPPFKDRLKDSSGS